MTDQWMPISSAPKNGRRVLVFTTTYGPFTAHFDKKWHIAGLWNPELPTHWMPLPDPPAGQSED